MAWQAQGIAGLRSVIVLALLCISPLLSAQSGAAEPLMMWEEPSHKVVFSRGHIRVMDVFFPGGATSDYVFVQPGRVADQTYGEPWLKLPETAISRGQILVRSNYLSENLLHRVRNIDTQPTQIFAVVNLGPIDARPSPQDGREVDGRIDNPWFRVRRVPAGAGEHSSPIAVTEDAILMQVHDGASHAVIDGQPGHYKSTGGAFSFHPAGTVLVVVNEAGTDESFVLIEVKE
jgi:hypothetical protein